MALKGRSQSSMINRFDTDERPNLEQLPSAEAQDKVPFSGIPSAPPVRRNGFLKSTFKLLVFLCVFIAVVFGALVFFLSRGPVSHEQIRAGLEGQISALIGADHSTKIGSAKIALGHGGLVAIDADRVTLLRDGKVNLGVAKQLAIKLKPMPLLGGEVVAQSVRLTGASISIDRLAGKASNYSVSGVQTELKPAWPRSVNIESAMRAVGETIQQVAASLQDSGLESIELDEADLVGFDQFGMRSRTAKLKDFKLSKQSGNSSNLNLQGQLETQFNAWNVAGGWTRSGNGNGLLELTISGLQLIDLMGASREALPSLELNSPVSISLSSPFLSDGTPQQATVSIAVANGSAVFEEEVWTDQVSGVLNLRILPGENQIELERSTLSINDKEVVLVGGIRYPVSVDDDVSAVPVYRLAVERFQAFGLVKSEVPPVGSLTVEGSIDPNRQLVVVRSAKLSTPSGKAEATASAQFDQDAPHLKGELNVSSVSLDEFKEFWPFFLAPEARSWVKDGLSDGVVENAWFKADFPPGLLGKEAQYQEENLSGSIPISGATIVTAGKLPDVQNARGRVSLSGNTSRVEIERGDLSVRNAGKLVLGKTSLQLGDFSEPDIDSTLNVSVSGNANSMVSLLSLDPLDYAKALQLEPGGLSGRGTATVSANLVLGKEEVKLGPRAWKARINLKDGASRKPISGRRVSRINAVIDATPKSAKITGTASIDGVPAKIALVQPLNGGPAQGGEVSITLNAKQRKQMGIDTGVILSGPVGVKLSGQSGGAQSITVDLKQASLNFPWIGWSKGKGIAATASFKLSEKGGSQTLSEFRLKGRGFSANGTIKVNRNGLQSAVLKNVKLNKTDDFDADVSRIKGGYKIGLNARSYDGRALIRSYLGEARKKDSGNQTVVISGQVRRLMGFDGQILSGVSINFTQRGTRISKAIIKALAAGNAPTVFALEPVSGGMKTKITTSNAGSVLRFLDLYSKVRGGSINATLVRDQSQVFRGVVQARNFTLLGEPRLAQLLQKPRLPNSIDDRNQVVKRLKQIRTDRAKVDSLQARIEKGPGFLNISKGRLSGGDASAAFEGRVYDRNDRMNVKGTFLPGRGLNKLVSKIPLIGLAFGSGKVNGLLGITFRLSGAYGNPRLEVNPLSIIAPGVFRQIFKF